MLSGGKSEPIVNKSLHQKIKGAKEGQKQVNTLEVEESKFNMVQPIEKEKKQTDKPLSYAAVTKNTKCSLPPNTSFSCLTTQHTHISIIYFNVTQFFTEI